MRRRPVAALRLPDTDPTLCGPQAAAECPWRAIVNFPPPPNRARMLPSDRGCPENAPGRPSAARNPHSASDEAQGPPEAHRGRPVASAAPGAPAEQIAVLVATAARRRLDADETETLRAWFASTHQALGFVRAQRDRLAADLEAERAAAYRWDGGPSRLTPKPGATEGAARALAARWDTHCHWGAR